MEGGKTQKPIIVVTGLTTILQENNTNAKQRKQFLFSFFFDLFLCRFFFFLNEYKGSENKCIVRSPTERVSVSVYEDEAFIQKMKCTLRSYALCVAARKQGKNKTSDSDSGKYASENHHVGLGMHGTDWI